MNPEELNLMRMAGSNLGTYLKNVGVLGSKVGSVTQKAVTRSLANSPLLQTVGAGTAEEAAQALSNIPVIGKTLAAAPISTQTWQSLAGNAPGAIGTAAGLGANLATNIGVPPITTAVQQAAKNAVVPRPQRQQVMPRFSQQAYIPGMSPLTNEQAGWAMLEQQKFANQLQLLQAKEQQQRPTQATIGYKQIGVNPSDLVNQALKASSRVTNYTPQTY